MEERAAPDAAFAALLRARRYAEVGRHADAEAELRGGLAAWPDDPDLHGQLAEALGRQGRWEEALEAAGECVRLVPEHPRAHLLVGWSSMNLGRNVEAERALLEGLRLDPESAQLYHVYGVLLHRTGHLEKAERVLRRALELEPEDPDVHALLALVLGETNGKLPAAERHGAKGLALAPDRDFPHLSAGLAALRSGHPFRARRHLREALRLDPGDRDVEELWLEADRCCRVVYLPMYWWSWLLHRLPGRQFAVWGAFLAFVLAGPRLGIPGSVVSVLAFCYVSVCLYTWISTPLVKAWVRWFPPR